MAGAGTARVFHGGLLELRLGDYREVLADVEPDAVITDPPFSARVHAGQRTGTRPRGGGGRKTTLYELACKRIERTPITPPLFIDEPRREEQAGLLFDDLAEHGEAAE